jgi:hypothetical protein
MYFKATHSSKAELYCFWEKQLDVRKSSTWLKENKKKLEIRQRTLKLKCNNKDLLF